jgi:hypothetical protein
VNRRSKNDMGVNREPDSLKRDAFPWEPADETVTWHARVRVKGGEGYAQLEMTTSAEEALELADKKYRPERLDIVMARMRAKMEVMR